MPRPDLARLFDAEQDRLLALCLRLTNDRATAEDALQDTFLLACRHAGSFRAESTPETWLYRIAIRAAQARRERDRTARTRDRSRPPPAPESPAPETDETASLRAALDALPDHHRLVLTLLSLRGLPARLVAEILGIPENTVYTRAHAARKALRAKLTPMEPRA